jgi:hypothetical protein
MAMMMAMMPSIRSVLLSLAGLRVAGGVLGHGELEQIHSSSFARSDDD